MRQFTPGELVAERFRIVRFIAEGGMGQVYEAEDLELGEAVALKFLSRRRAGHARSMERFRREYDEFDQWLKSREED
jgi:serine/threonine protein kinase